MIQHQLEDLGNFYINGQFDNSIYNFLELADNTQEYMLEPIFRNSKKNKIELTGYHIYEIKSNLLHVENLVDELYVKLKDVLRSNVNLQIKNTAVDMAMKYYANILKKNLDNNCYDLGLDVFKDYSLYAKRDIYCCALDNYLATKKLNLDIFSNLPERDLMDELFLNKSQKRMFSFQGLNSLDNLFEKKVYSDLNNYEKKYSDDLDIFEKKNIFKFSNRYKIRYNSKNNIISGYFRKRNLNSNSFIDENEKIA